MDNKNFTAPPCIQAGLKWSKCAEKQYDEQILNHIKLSNEWAGWRFAGRDLVCPDGNRINPRRLRGILWQEKQLSGGNGKSTISAVTSIRRINSDKPPNDVA